MVDTKQGSSSNPPPPPARTTRAYQRQTAVAGPSRPATMTTQQPVVVPQPQEEVMTQAPGAAEPQGLGIDVAQIIQQAVQASVQATQAVVQEALTAFRQTLAPPTTPVPPAPAAQPQTQTPHQPAGQLAP